METRMFLALGGSHVATLVAEHEILIGDLTFLVNEDLRFIHAEKAGRKFLQDLGT